MEAEYSTKVTVTVYRLKLQHVPQDLTLLQEGMLVSAYEQLSAVIN
jgi:hypothetical protein